jgi:poly-gamma-glutamate capsule biosynthesis protein CapA/YwtB (metallophosphatase superfamily)
MGGIMCKIIFCFVLVLICLGLIAQTRPQLIEDFESGEITLTSWADEDLEPDAWDLDSFLTYDSSSYSLCLSGNTWKEQVISPLSTTQNTVIELAAMYESGATVQGIGFSDGENQIFYSISGTLILDLEVWIPVYQGAYSSNSWHLYRLPLGADWESFFGYYPTLSSLIYINDLDDGNSRSVWFDQIQDITMDLPIAPQVSIFADIPVTLSAREVAVQFSATILDPDSDEFEYLWSFGDDNYSTEVAPYHVYELSDAHLYTVNLRVIDESGKVGFAATQIELDPGPSSLPLTLNFVGDVMLARRYDTQIIPYQGVNAIFAPTYSMLGAAADVTVANLEVVLADTGSPHPTKSVVYRGNPDNVSGLVFAGIDVVSTANNHTLDYGLPALEQTQNLLNANDILHSGAGSNSYAAYLPAFVNRKGLSIALLRSSDRTGQYNNAQPFLHAGFAKEGFAYMTPYHIQEQIAAVDAIADLNVVEMHAGSEYSLQPSVDYGKSNPFWEDTQDEDYAYRSDIPHQWDREIRHTAVDSGADLVVVHHPHIIQGLELYNGKVIAHSLGNFVFDLDYPECMNSMILYVDADEDGFSNHYVRPVYINDYIPLPATGQLGLYILDYVAMKSRELDTVVIVDKQELKAAVPLEPDNLTQTEHALQLHIEFDGFEDDYQYSKPIKLPRYGSISSVDTVSPVQDAELRLGSELIWYGGFEDEGSTLWSIPEFSTNAVDGERSAFLSAESSESITATISRKLKLYDNEKSYTLHGWIRSRNASAANITIRYYSSRNSYYPVATQTISEDLTGTNSWAWYFQELDPPSNAWYYDIRLSLQAVDVGISQAWFDNVGLIEWTPYQAVNELSDVMHPNNYYWFQLRSAESAKSLNCQLTETSFIRHNQRTAGTSTAAQLLVNIYPNPFNPDTNISFELAETGLTSVKIYNIKGQLIRELLNKELPAGQHRLIWDGRDHRGSMCSSGLHFIRIKSNDKQALRKAILLK